MDDMENITNFRVPGTVSRVTVVDWRRDAEFGLIFEQRNVSVYLDLQDDERTLKVFVMDRPDD